MIWVAPQMQLLANGNSDPADEVGAVATVVSRQQREAVCRVANAVRVLAALSMHIFPTSIQDVCKVCLTSVL